MSAFPLTKLPIVSIVEVMRMMDVSELLTLTSCTPKIQKLARKMKQIQLFSSLPCSQKESISVLDIFGLFRIQLMNGFPEFLEGNPILFNLIVTARMGIEINLRVEKNLKWYLFVESTGEKEKFSGDEHDFIVGDQLVPCISSRTKKELYTFWDDKKLGMQTLVDWIRKTLNVEFDALLVGAGDQPGYADELRSIVNHVKCVQSSYTNVTIDEKKALMKDDDLEFVRKTVTVRKKYYHLGGRTTLFNYEQQMEAELLLISFGHWFTFDHLMLTNCVFINIVDSPITNDDLSSFVRSTVEGSFPRLKRIIIKKPNVSVASILVFTGNRRGYIRDGVYSLSGNNIIPIRIGAVVEHESGSRAVTVTFPEQRKRLLVFEMLVWPDLEGNNFNTRNEIRPFGF